MGEVRCRRKTAPCGDVGHGVGFLAVRTPEQHRVGEVQAAGQDVPWDRGAVGGEDPGQLPLTDPDRRGNLLGAQAGIDPGALLYRSVRRRGALLLELRRLRPPVRRSIPAQCVRRLVRADRFVWPGW